MSRASGASFAQFFPAAPKAAKERAKERVKSKSQSIESPVSRAAADIQVVYNNTSRTDDAGLARPTDGHTSCADAAPALAEDNESLPGDILNGVGSASSHSSTVSSVFSAPAQPSTILNSGTAQNVSSLTPLTNIDSSLILAQAQVGINQALKQRMRVALLLLIRSSHKRTSRNRNLQIQTQTLQILESQLEIQLEV